MLKRDRKRKTKDPCPGCFLHKDLCICAEIPILALRTRVTVVAHHRELKRTTNTGRLAVKSLSNSELRVRGLIGEKLDLRDLVLGNYQNLLFFPHDEAQPLTRELIQSNARAVHLIVPDGNWRQASKVLSRHPELASLPKVKLNLNSESRANRTSNLNLGYPATGASSSNSGSRANQARSAVPEMTAGLKGLQVLRQETKPEGHATLEAIAEAMAVLEGFEVAAELHRVYQLKLKATLKGRGYSV